MTDASDRLMERHKSLYFADGNVALLAPRPDKPGLLFRVHKSVLSSHSPIFMDMFDVCNPSDGKSRTEADSFSDGVPLIRMSDDANHLESVLMILYYQSTLPWVPRSPHYPGLVTPLLEMSRKYGIARIRDQIQGHLESDWPQTLHDWDRLERDIEFMANDTRVARIDDCLPEPAAAIKLARQFDIPSILPAAFYHLSRLSILDDWDRTRADSSICALKPTQRTARWGLLSAEDFRCHLLGKVEFAQILRGCIAAKELVHPRRLKDWDFDQDCRVGEGIWKAICDRCLQSADPLAQLKSGSITTEEEKNRCSTCTAALRAKIPTVRAKVWEKLEDLFHLKDQ